MHCGIQCNVQCIPSFLTYSYVRMLAFITLTLLVACSAFSDTIIRKCLHELVSPNHFTRMGFSLALGALPRMLLHGVLKPVLSRLAQLTSAVQETESKFAEARRDAIRAITRCVWGGRGEWVGGWCGGWGGGGGWCVYVCVRTHAHVCVCMCTHAYTCVCACAHECACMCVCVRVHVCACVCVHECAYCVFHPPQTQPTPSC